MAATTEKVTFALPAELVRQMRTVVQKGTFASQNALVREALVHELKRVREAEFAREMEEAARDPLFMQDMQQAMDDFQHVDSESARIIAVDEDFDVEA
jgi:Arc/MetJ-type ribon-helix-helix transcriptional regulator